MRRFHLNKLLSGISYPAKAWFLAFLAAALL